MKRIKNVLIMILLTLLTPLMVYADMGAPEISPYEVIVTNKDGAKMEDSDTVIPYDTKLTITYDFDRDGRLYGYVDYQGKPGTIRLSDTKIYDTTIDFSKFYKAETPIKQIVIDDDCYLYNGPSKHYGKVEKNGRIPKGEIVEYTYYDQIWAYVTYKGVSGWVYNYPHFEIYSDLHNSLASIATEGRILTTKNVTELKVNPTSDETVKVNIPPMIELSYEYYVPQIRNRMVYLEYEGKSGWLKVVQDGMEESTSGLVKKHCMTDYIFDREGVPIYDTFRDMNSKSGKVIPHGTEVKVLYSTWIDDFYWEKVIYEGEEVWIVYTTDDYHVLQNEGIYSIFSIKMNLDVHREIDKASEVIDTLEPGDKITTSYYLNESAGGRGMWVYIEEGAKHGWVYLENDTFEREEETVYACEHMPEEEQPRNEESTEGEENFLTPKEQLIFIIASSIVLALVVGVTIVIINKKKTSRVRV